MTNNNKLIYPALDVANHLIELTIPNKEYLTQIKILKLLYFMQAFHLVEYNVPLIKERFEAWKYGPVLRNLYEDHLSKFGYLHVTRMLGKGNETKLYNKLSEDEMAQSTIRKCYDGLSKCSASQLVDKTHSPNGAWMLTYLTSPYSEIPNEEIQMEFWGKGDELFQ